MCRDLWCLLKGVLPLPLWSATGQRAVSSSFLARSLERLSPLGQLPVCTIWNTEALLSPYPHQPRWAVVGRTRRAARRALPCLGPSWALKLSPSVLVKLTASATFPYEFHYLSSSLQRISSQLNGDRKSVV